MSKNTELLGVKVKPEIKERLNQLIEQAKTAGMIEYNGDIFELLLKSFEHEQLASKMAYGADLKELNQITQRISEIFVNLAKQNETNITFIQREHEQTVEKLKEEIQSLKEKQELLYNQLTEKDDNINGLTNIIKVNEKRIEELEEIQTSTQERIEELKNVIATKDEQIATKEKLLSEKLEEISAMQHDISRNAELQETIKNMQKEKEKLQAAIENKDKEIQAIKEQLKFECEKAIFAKERELQQQYEKRISEITSKYDERLFEMNQKRDEALERYEKLLAENRELERKNLELEKKIDQLKSE